MAEIIEIPVELAHFRLPEAVQARLQFLLDRQDAGERLTQAETREAEGLVELAEFSSLLRLRSQRIVQRSIDDSDSRFFVTVGHSKGGRSL